MSDHNDADQRDDGRDLFLAGERFVDEEGTGPADDDGSQEGYYYSLGHGNVLEGV